MAKKTLAELKAQYAADTKPQGGGNRNNGKYYPFWDMPTNQRCVVRFLPDLNEDNPRGFLVEKVFHNLTINGQRETVPCLSMYDEDCPICKLSQDYYKAKDETNGKKYWRKKQYVAQAIVVEDPIAADAATGETHAGKVRFFALGFQIHNIIKDAFASEDDPLESIPYEFNDGYDFVIKKTEKGGYADYTVGTKFLSKQRALSEEEIAEVSEGMVDLTTLLPKNPGIEKVQALLNADLNGGTVAADDESFEQANPAAKQSFTVAAPKPAAPAAKPAAPVAESTSVGDSSVDSMLETIRKRRAAAAANAA